MKEEFMITMTQAESIINTGRNILDSNPRYLSKFLTFKNPDIKPSDVSQFRLMPPTPTNSVSTGVKVKNKYPVEQCRHFMKEVSEAGFGTFTEILRGLSLRNELTFCKRQYSKLGDCQIETLEKLKIDEELIQTQKQTILFCTYTSYSTY